jgi:hypothetical protein
MSFWEFIDSAQENRCDYQRVVRAVLKTQGMRAFASVKSVRSLLGARIKSIWLWRPPTFALRGFAFFGGVAAVPRGTVHWTMFEKSVDSKEVSFPKKISK